MKIEWQRNLWWRQLSVALLSIALLASSAFGWQQQAGVAPAPATTLSTAERELGASVKVETIREVVTALSADEMQGRGTMQPGGEKAAQYIADRFKRLGLKPLGTNNSYLQPIKFREMEFTPETNLTVGDATLKPGSDFFIAPPFTGDKSVSGNLVFVAYGLVSDAPRRNDLAGIDVNGKVVVMIEGPPKNVDKAAWRRSEAQINVLRTLIRGGAAGLIFVSNGTEEHPYSEMADYMTRRQVELAGEAEPDLSFLPPFLYVSNQTAEKLFAASGTSFAQAMTQAEGESFRPFDLKKTAKITVRAKKANGTSSNVVGLLEGSDPRLKAEAVVFTAHYDAYGVGAGNRIYHGAADNALGVGEMIAIAEALSKSAVRPRRSMIFLALTGEEYGGYGSQYWVKNPTWSIKQVAADLNFDGMGTEVYGPVKTLVGFGAEHSNLGAMLNDVAVAHGLRVVPDPMPAEKAFYRSDHYFFVKKGVPALMLLGAPEGETSKWIERMKQWEKTDYHQPTDIIRPDWNWDGPRMMAVTGVVLGMRIANSEQMPAWVSTSPFNRERGTNEPAPPEP
ncbi:MAG TPA: M28 family peptidase [Pyrinomonadaceae bacterium]|jgi:Zn-dependent M28 family amino/carboxypeptidase